MSDPFVNVKIDFGAVGDGGADDRKSIQDAIDSVGVKGGGTVFFPDGVYRVKGDGLTGNTVALRLRYSNVWLVGKQGRSEIRSTEINGANNAHVIAIVVSDSSGTGVITNSGVRDLRITSTSPLPPKYLIGNGLITFYGDSVDCFVDRCAINTKGLCGVTTGPSPTTTKLRITETTFEEVAEHGIYMGGTDNLDCLVDQCRFEGCGAPADEPRPTAVALKNTTRLAIRRSYFTGFRNSAINPAHNNNTDLLIESNEFANLRHYGEAGINADYITRGVIRNNRFRGVSDTAIFVRPVAGTAVSDLVIEGNDFRDVGGMGICVERDESSGSTPQRIVIKGNRVLDSRSHGIQIDGVRGVSRVCHNAARCTSPSLNAGVRVLNDDNQTSVDHNTVWNMAAGWGNGPSVKTGNDVF